MTDQLRGKEQGEPITVHRGSFETFELERRYSLVYVVFNTLFALPSQEAQVRCFAAAARHLEKAGALLIEAFVPDLGHFDRGQSVRVMELGLDRVLLSAAKVHPASQHVETNHIVLFEVGISIYPVKLRYAWPAELDLMAQLAGLRLESRWSDWSGSPFDGASKKHVSVYRWPADQEVEVR